MNWGKNRGERLKDEIQAHIDFEIQEQIEAGMSLSKRVEQR